MNTTSQEYYTPNYYNLKYNNRNQEKAKEALDKSKGVFEWLKSLSQYNLEGIDAFKLLFMPTLSYDKDLHPLAFTMDDYKDSLGVVEEIIKTGIEIPLT